eukprot:jgi/Psemu1/49913/gm1.49913_g
MNIPLDFDDGENETGYCELDSHITTHVDVAPFSEEYKPIKKIPIGSCAAAWTSPTSVRDCNFNSVEETPRQFDPRSSKHGITIQTPMEDDDPKKIFIKLNMRNVISYFPTRKPTKLKLDECEHLTATNDTPWDPHSLKFRIAELAIDNGDPISGDQLSVQAMSTEDASSVVREPTSNVTDMFPKTSKETKHPNLMQHCKLMRLHQVSTRRMLTECQIATDGNISHRISSVSTIFQGANISSAQRKDQFLFDDTEFDFTEAPENKSKQIPSSQEIDNTLERKSLDRRNQWGPSVTTIEGPNKVDCERLAKTWNISFKKAKQTLKVTTQKALRNLQLPLMKCLPTQRFRNKRVAQGTWYTDTWHAKTTSVMRQEKCAQVFTNGNGFEVFIPIQNKLQAHQGLKIFIHEVGIPEHLISDGAPEQGSPRTYKTHWNSIVKRNHIHQKFIQPHCPFQYRAEQAIGHLGSAIITKTAKKKTPFELVHGYRPDITLYTSSEWYDFIFWFDKGDSLSHGVERLGPIPISTNSIRPVKEFEWRDCDVLRRMEAIDKSIESKIGDEGKDSASFFQENYPETPEELFDEQPVRSSDLKLEMAEPEASVEDIDEFDEYLGNEVIIERNDERLRCIVKDRVPDLQNQPIGVRNENSILDTRLYKLQLPDGTIEEYTANIVAESLYSSVDDDGRMFTLLDELIDHEQEDTALSDKEATTIAKNGRTDISQQLEAGGFCPLSDVKESFPVQLAEYAVNNKLEKLPASRWWVHKILRREERILKAAKSAKYWLKSHKYGVEFPRSITQALAIDKKTGTDHWERAINKEMTNNMAAFEFSDDDIIPVGHKEITTHMIFDIKLGSLTRKAWLIGDGHKVLAIAKENTSSSVLSRDSVRIFFLLAALNDWKKYFLRARAEDGFPPHLAGCPCKIARARYGLPVAGASFRSYLTKHFRDLGYAPSMLIAYVDDILCSREDSKFQLENIERKFKLKDDY